MKLIHRMVLKQLPGPFLAWLFLFLFLLLMQFLIKFLPELTGRDLPITLILELIVYNLAYMVVLAVPMSSLLAILMVFGTLAESRTWVVIRNCGITLWSVTWPVLAAAALLSWGMMYFNNVLLPESNFRALNMWQTIRNARPGFELQPGVFYQDIDEYSILVERREGNLLYDVLIYDYTQGIANGATIRAERGELIPQGNFLDMILLDGEVHRLFRPSNANTTERYEKLTFERFQLRLDLSELGFQGKPETEGYRSDRSTPVSRMLEIVDSLEHRLAEQTSELQSIAPAPFSSETHTDASSTEIYPGTAGPRLHQRRTETSLVFHRDTTTDSDVQRRVLIGLSADQIQRVYQRAREYGQNMRSTAASKGRNLRRTTTAISRYQVEIHKKYSISVACFIFVLIGMPLGLSIRRGGLGVACLAAVSIFIFYWITLVQGEKLADRELLTPWIGMWCANILIGIVGIWLFVRVALDMKARPHRAVRTGTAARRDRND